MFKEHKIPSSMHAMGSSIFSMNLPRVEVVLRMSYWEGCGSAGKSLSTSSPPFISMVSCASIACITVSQCLSSSESFSFFASLSINLSLRAIIFSEIYKRPIFRVAMGFCAI